MTWIPKEVRSVREHPLPYELLEVKLEDDESGGAMLLRFAQVDGVVQFHHEKVYDTVEIHNVNEQAIKSAAEYLNERFKAMTVLVSVEQDDGEADVISADEL